MAATPDDTTPDDAAPDDSANRLVGQRASMSRKGLVLLVVSYLCYTVWGIVRGHYELSVMIVLLGGFLVFRIIRPPTVVDRTGVRRPWRRPAIVSWSEVASVAAPELGIVGVRLTLTTGKTIRLQDIPTKLSQQVAALGVKKVLTPAPLRVPPRSPGVRSDAEIAADVDRRAKALSEEWRRLDAQSPHWPPRPSE